MHSKTNAQNGHKLWNICHSLDLTRFFETFNILCHLYLLLVSHQHGNLIKTLEQIPRTKHTNFLCHIEAEIIHSESLEVFFPKIWVHHVFSKHIYKSMEKFFRVDVWKNFLHPDLPWYAVDIEDAITIYNLKEKKIVKGKNKNKGSSLFLRTKGTTVAHFIVLKFDLHTHRCK